MPLVVVITACSAGQPNNFCFKPIDFQVLRRAGLAGNPADIG
jgi:uncharacterized protein